MRSFNNEKVHQFHVARFVIFVALYMLFQYHCIDEFFAAHGSRKLMFFYQAMSVSYVSVIRKAFCRV